MTSVSMTGRLRTLTAKATVQVRSKSVGVVSRVSRTVLVGMKRYSPTFPVGWTLKVTPLQADPAEPIAVVQVTLAGEPTGHPTISNTGGFSPLAAGHSE